MRKLELLSPAGDMERLEMAVAYGADAVYFAGTSFGMRSFAGNFSPEELPKAVRYAHDHGVKCHVTVNTMPRNDEIARLPEYLEQAAASGADALIVKPAGPYGDIIRLVREHVEVPLCAYQVSGEYAMIRAAGLNGWIDERAVMLESLLGLKRAGADMIITYFAEEILRQRLAR